MNTFLGAELPSLAVLAERVGASLRRRGESVAIVESSAGGLVSASLLAIPGASAFYLGGAVVYSRRAGRALLGLSAADLAGMGGETEPYALLVAGRLGDKLSLGFVAETEPQAEAHLDSHLDRLPAPDHSSRAIVTQMKLDEARHAANAVSAGAAELPPPAKAMMRLAARVMTTVAHRI